MVVCSYLNYHVLELFSQDDLCDDPVVLVSCHVVSVEHHLEKDSRNEKSYLWAVEFP